MSSLSVKDAWNAVAIEERFELLARAKAEGIVAGLSVTLLIGSSAYGFDKIWMLAIGAFLAVLVMPLFASYSWRRNKPAVILSYLAVRSVARRYAYGYKIQDFAVVLIFRGRAEIVFENEEEEQLEKQRETIDFDTKLGKVKDVWIVLMRGGVVLLSERRGGAKLEFIGQTSPELSIRKPHQREGLPERSVVLEYQSGPEKKRKVVAVTSDYPGALYVFEKQMHRLLEEDRLRRERIEKSAKVQQIGA